MNQNKQSNLPHEFKVMRVRECVAPSLVDNPQRAYEYWKANIPQSDWYDEAKEAFVVLVLNTRSRIIGHNLVTLGLVDQCLVHCREVFRAAICAAGKEIILMHNHPSGQSIPSEQDIRVTRDLVRAGQLLGIAIRDHIVVGRQELDYKGYTSMRECGYFDT